MRSVYLFGLFLFLTPLPALAATDAAAKSEQLEALRDRIYDIQQEQQEAISERSDVIAALRDAEQKLAALNRELATLGDKISTQDVKLKDLQREQQATEKTLQSQKDALIEQIRAAYTAGREEKLKLLLNQQDPVLLGRMLVYYAYVNQARAEMIKAVRNTLTHLTRLGESIRTERARLDNLLAERQTVRDDLAATLASRKHALAKLETAIDSREGRLAKLRLDEQNLAVLVRRLQDAFADIPDNLGDGPSFDSRRGGLNWPIEGNIVHHYGDPRPGGMQWQGVLINTGRGNKVQAVARGRVAYADWLPHYGMLVIIEHGDGYMSLYGHNQALYTQAGDWVQQGETIATVGETGGRNEPGLYFEIRKNGKPVNPADWLERH